MKLPNIEKPSRYVGLYAIDFGDHASVGFTAAEVAQILESLRFADCKIFKIHRACPDGTMELKGVPSETFQLEAGMFFYCRDHAQARDNFDRMAKLAAKNPFPCRAAMHLSRSPDGGFVVAVIYPAEYDDEVSRLLANANYFTAGQAEGGTCAVQRYYDGQWEVLARRQLFAEEEPAGQTGKYLIAASGLRLRR